MLNLSLLTGEFPDEWCVGLITPPTGMPHGPHLGPKWAAKWVPLGHPKWDPLSFVRGAHMGPK